MISDRTNYQLKYSFLKHLFVECEDRGKDATGFAGIGDYAFLQKQPITASRFIKTRQFKQLLELKPSLLIGHTRQATQGDKEKNKNNHPFELGDLYLTHNGVIHNYEELQAKYKFDLKSLCDSEILLHIIASKKNIIQGIKEVYEQVDGTFAVALLNKANKSVYLFRNTGNPIYTAFSEKYNMFAYGSTKIIVDRACDDTWYFNSFDKIFDAHSLLPEKSVVRVSLDDKGIVAYKQIRLKVVEKPSFSSSNYDRYKGRYNKGTMGATGLANDLWYERAGTIYYNPKTHEKYCYDAGVKMLYILPLSPTEQALAQKDLERRKGDIKPILIEDKIKTITITPETTDEQLEKLIDEQLKDQRGI